MNQISVLSQETIDKIAAGEVVERPASIVKELVENAIDAGANAITVEIKEGGISMIRITDNGCGIPAEEVRVAFLRHATSKIRNVEDLLTAGTLGFRGEALSSIAAVCQVEMITKTAGSITGVRYVIEGGAEHSLDEIGAPEGTTFIVKNLFYNTPARRKFLKTAATEAGYVSDLMERMAISHPGISFKFINNNDCRMHTSGNCNLKDIIYGIYGRDIAANLIRLDWSEGKTHITGFIGKPVISRGNRNYENYFVNGRYVKSAIIARGIEDAYKAFMMNHRYPFTALLIEVDSGEVDINVHPTKMEVRFADQQKIYEQVSAVVKDALAGKELIPEFTVDQKQTVKKHLISETKQDKQSETPKNNTPEKKKFTYPEPFERIRSQLIAEANSPYQRKYTERKDAFRPVTGNVGFQEKKADAAVSAGRVQDTSVPEITPAQQESIQEPIQETVQRPVQETVQKTIQRPVQETVQETVQKTIQETIQRPVQEIIREEIAENRKAQKLIPQQMELFEEKLLDQKNRKYHKLIGQIFETYWIVEFDEKMYIIDQHAAHEKVMYERFMEQLKKKIQTSQMITPPVIVTLSMQEENTLKTHLHHFTEIGFEIDHFGGRDYSISAVPGNIYGIADKTLFLEMLDGLTDVSEKASDQIITEKIASMACKAAVKGKHRLSVQEADKLIDELLSLENPYNCPHGRPTIIEMSRYELEKKFKRII